MALPGWRTTRSRTASAPGTSAANWPATTIRIPNNRNAEKGDCNFDRRHIFNTTLVATSPGVGTGALKGLTEGWQVAPIVSFNSGQPFSVTDGTDVSLTGENSDRPNVVPGVSSLPHTLVQWFNPAAFAGSCALAQYAGNPYCQAPGTFGNAGRDIFHGPGSHSVGYVP